MAQPGVRIKKFISPFSFFVFIFFLLACNSPKQEQVQETQQPVPVVNVPSFNPDSAYIYTKVQVDFGPRIPNSVAHTKCGDYLAASLKQWCDTFIEQKAPITAYDGKVLQMRNMIGSFNPSVANRILFTAHWDTRPWADQDTVNKDKPIDGANDGAAPVGTLLEIARQLALSNTNLGVDIIFFDLEDYGKTEHDNSYCYGSQYWTQHKHVERYQARFGILLDMTAAAHGTFTKEGTSMQYAPDIVNMVWHTAAAAGYSDYFVQDETTGIIDDHYYINKMGGIKCIDIVHYDYNTPSHFWKYWHTHGDSMDKIDKNTMKAVGQTLLEVVFRNPS